MVVGFLDGCSRPMPVTDRQPGVEHLLETGGWPLSFRSGHSAPLPAIMARSVHPPRCIQHQIPPRVHAFGTLPTPIGCTPILVRVFKPADTVSLIWLKNNSPVWGNPLYEPTVLLY
jgi:hypothetical protein